MSDRIVICCPNCRRLFKYISYGMAWTEEDQKAIDEQKKRDLDTLKFKCCGKEFTAREGWAA